MGWLRANKVIGSSANSECRAARFIAECCLRVGSRQVVEMGGHNRNTTPGPPDGVPLSDACDSRLPRAVTHIGTHTANEAVFGPLFLSLRHVCANIQDPDSTLHAPPPPRAVRSLFDEGGGGAPASAVHTNRERARQWPWCTIDTFLSEERDGSLACGGAAGEFDAVRRRDARMLTPRPTSRLC